MMKEGTQSTEEIYKEAIQISIGGENHILIYGSHKSVYKFLESCIKAGLVIEVEVSSDWCG
jgi:hypothetical protein